MRPVKWLPSHAPEIATRMGKWLGYASNSMALTGTLDEAAQRDQLSAVGMLVQISALYWVAAHVSPVIEHLIEHDLGDDLGEQLPSDEGVIFWDEPVVTDTQWDKPVAAAFWSRRPEDGRWFVQTFVSLGREQIETNLARARENVAKAGRGHLATEPFDILLSGVPTIGSWHADNDTSDPVIKAVAATLLAANSDQLTQVTDRTTQPRSNAAKRRSRQVKPRTVRVVSLRKPPATGRHDGESEREYSHRWLVSGHLRSQPYGKGRTKRRLQWIAPYIKGPEGADVLPPARTVKHIR